MLACQVEIDSRSWRDTRGTRSGDRSVKNEHTYKHKPLNRGSKCWARFGDTHACPGSTPGSHRSALLQLLQFPFRVVAKLLEQRSVFARLHRTGIGPCAFVDAVESIASGNAQPHCHLSEVVRCRTASLWGLSCVWRLPAWGWKHPTCFLSSPVWQGLY